MKFLIKNLNKVDEAEEAIASLVDSMEAFGGEPPEILEEVFKPEVPTFFCHPHHNCRNHHLDHTHPSLLCHCENITLTLLLRKLYFCYFYVFFCLEPVKSSVCD